MSTAEDSAPVGWRRLDDPSGFRVIVLEPGIDDEQLMCDLLELTFDTLEEEYVAISYAWGTTELTHEITCCNQRVRITANLHSALRRVRQPATALHVWCDALCIRQGDDSAALVERSHQISLMSRIFSTAARVIVDLGDDDGSLSYAVLGFNAILKVPESRRVKVDEHPDPLKYLDLPDFTHPMWLALRALFQRQWFLRLWSVFTFLENRRYHCGSPHE